MFKGRAINIHYTNHSADNRSRGEMLAWVNETLKSDFRKIDELCTGAAYCQLMDLLFPKSVALHLVKFMTNIEVEFIDNFKILQAGFNKMSVTQVIPVEKLIKGRFQDNLEFLQYFRKFFDANVGEGREYDASAVRDGAPMGFGSAIGTHRRRTPTTMQMRSVDATPPRIPTADIMSPKTKIPLLSTSSGPPIQRLSNKLKAMPNGSGTKEEMDVESCIQEVKEVGCQSDTPEILNEEIPNDMEEMGRKLRLMAKERDFYFGKCRKIELLCNQVDQGEGHLSRDMVTGVLYATEDGFDPI